MKVIYKAVLALMCIAMLISSGGALWAKEEFDAFNVNDSEASEYKFKPADTAVKMYSGIFCYDFANGRDIYDIVRTSEDKTAYLISSDNMIEIRYKDKDQVHTAPISCLARSCLSQICVLAKNHGTYFDADVEVINTYIFHEMWGFSIYFVTNKGNFVMYKDSVVSEVIYLIPDEVYRECASGMVNFIRSTEGGACPSYGLFAELSDYQIYPEKFPEIIPTPEQTLKEEENTKTEDTVSPETHPVKETEEIDEEKTEKQESGASASVAVLPVIIVSAIPTLVLGAVVIVLLKRR